MVVDVRAAPIVAYMTHWTEAQIRAYCQRKGWRCYTLREAEQMKRQTKTKARHKAKPGRKEYDNTNRGALFVNDRKKKDSDPDYTGVGNLNGVECFINGWVVPKEERNAKSPVVRLSLKEKGDREQPPTSGRKQAPAAKPGADFDDDLPF